MTGTVIQVANVSLSASLEQMETAFGYVGEIDDIVIFPKENIVPQGTHQPVNQARICFIKFKDPECALVARQLTNTVFIDKALIVTGSTIEKIPDEATAFQIAAPLINIAASIDAANKIPGQPSMIRSPVDPNLSLLGLPQPPPLPAGTDPSKVEEIRRTVYVGNLDPTVTPEQILEHFNAIAEVKYIRMAGDESLPARCCYIEFSHHASVKNALNQSGIQLGTRQIQVNHASISIVKSMSAPVETTSSREMEEAMMRVRDAQALIQSAIDPNVLSTLEKEKLKKKSRSRSRSKRRSRSGSGSRSSKHRHSSSRRSRSRSKSLKRRSRSPKSSRSRRSSRSPSKSTRKSSPRDKSKDVLKSARKSRSKSRDKDRHSSVNSTKRRRSRSKSKDHRRSSPSRKDRRRDGERSKEKETPKSKSSSSTSLHKSRSPVKEKSSPSRDKTKRSKVKRDYDEEEKGFDNSPTKSAPATATEAPEAPTQTPVAEDEDENIVDNVTSTPEADTIDEPTVEHDEVEVSLKREPESSPTPTPAPTPTPDDGDTGTPGAPDENITQDDMDISD